MTISSIIMPHEGKKPPFCSSQNSILGAASEIAALDVNALAVVDEGILVGIITDHDIIRCLAASGSKIGNETVSDWMTSKVISCTEDTKLTDALSLMARHRIRHLLITDGERPVTVLSSKELLTRIHENDELEISVLRDLARVNRFSQIA